MSDEVTLRLSAREMELEQGCAYGRIKLKGIEFAVILKGHRAVMWTMPQKFDRIVLELPQVRVILPKGGTTVEVDAIVNGVAIRVHLHRHYQGSHDRSEEAEAKIEWPT